MSGRYFGEVTILLPSHWPDNDTIDATTESAQQATFSVEQDSPEWGSNPHTLRLLGDCGSPGKVTILPESFTKYKAEAQKYGANIGEQFKPLQVKCKRRLVRRHAICLSMLYSYVTPISN